MNAKAIKFTGKKNNQLPLNGVSTLIRLILKMIVELRGEKENIHLSEISLMPDV